jgi:phytanoyl-CoA hydroxylase
MEWEHCKSQYDEQGFVVIRQFLPTDEFELLERELARYVREVVPTLPDAQAFYEDKSRPETLKQMQHMSLDPFFEVYRRHPRWVALARALVGEDVEAMGPEWFNKPPGLSSPTPAHQDNYYFCLSPPNVITIWLALDSVDDGNGCLRYVRGSHRRGIRPHNRSNVLGFSQGIMDYGSSDTADEVPVHLEPGDAVAHHGNTIHRADANTSADRNRRAFAMVFKGHSCRRDELAFQRYREALQSQHAAMGLKT